MFSCRGDFQFDEKQLTSPMNPICGPVKNTDRSVFADKATAAQEKQRPATTAQ